MSSELWIIHKMYWSKAAVVCYMLDLPLGK